MNEEKEKALKVLNKWKNIYTGVKKVLDKKEFVPGKGYQDLIDNVATAEYAIDAIIQVEEQEKCLNEILTYTNLYADFHVWNEVKNIIKRHKEAIQDLKKP